MNPPELTQRTTPTHARIEAMAAGVPRVDRGSAPRTAWCIPLPPLSRTLSNVPATR
jgi:hypothetical protein